MLVKAKINVTWRQLIMRHNHKNHIGSRLQVCLWLPSKFEKPRKHIGHQNPKNRFIFAKKPKTRMLIKRKTRNRIKTDNKTETLKFFSAKTENSTVPLCYRNTTLSTRYLQNTTQNSPPLFLALLTSIAGPSKYWTIMIKQGRWLRKLIVLIGITILTPPTLPTGDKTAILRGYPTSVHVFAFHVNELQSRINKDGVVPSDL